MLVEVVAVHAADEDALPVDQQVHAADLDPAEADPDRRGLDDGSVGGPQGDREVVQVRGLGGPSLDIGKPEVPADPADERRRLAGELLVPGRASWSPVTAAGPPMM